MMTPEQTWWAVFAILLLALGVACLLRLILTVHRVTDPWPTPPSKWQPPSKEPWWIRHELKVNAVMLAVAVMLAGVLGPPVDKHSQRTEVAQR